MRRPRCAASSCWPPIGLTPTRWSHAGPAIAAACAACQQVTGAIGFTLEYPLHRYTQRAWALATWNEALLDALTG